VYLSLSLTLDSVSVSVSVWLYASSVSLCLSVCMRALQGRMSACDISTHLFSSVAHGRAHKQLKDVLVFQGVTIPDFVSSPTAGAGFAAGAGE
jgi:hypothetical protein